MNFNFFFIFWGRWLTRRVNEYRFVLRADVRVRVPSALLWVRVEISRAIQYDTHAKDSREAPPSAAAVRRPTLVQARLQLLW